MYVGASGVRDIKIGIYQIYNQSPGWVDASNKLDISYIRLGMLKEKLAEKGLPQNVSIHGYVGFEEVDISDDESLASVLVCAWKDNGQNELCLEC